MVKRILIVWAIANFAIVGLASWLAGGWYIGWYTSPTSVMVAELGLIMLPNLIVPLLVLRYWWPEQVDSVRDALGWRWNGWRSLGFSLLAFVIWYVLLGVITRLVGGSIPYHMPGTTGEGVAIAINSLWDVLTILSLLFGVLAFVVITIIGEETMFRGLVQTQMGKRYGTWAGLLMGAVLFGLRHLPADLFYARIWQATPQMWLSRQLQLYVGALCLGLARYFGKSTYASAMTHGLLFVVALLGLG